MSSRRALVIAALSAFGILGLSGLRLDSPPLVPEEAARLLDPGSPWSAGLALAEKLDISPETAVRLPGLLVAALAAGALTHGCVRRHAAVAGFLLVAFSPAIVAVARTAGPEPLALALGVLAALLLTRPAGRERLAGALLLLGAAALVCAPGKMARPDRMLAAALASWGLLFGPGLPPWRFDVVVPALAAALPALWLGAAPRAHQRILVLGGLCLLAATLGALAPRPTAAALAAAPLTPLVLLILARGVQQLPTWVPRYGLATLAVAGGLVGVGNLLAGSDLLDPARRVPWDEAARMLAVLAEEEATVVSSPGELPASLRLYAPALDFPLEHPARMRILVVSHGFRGGLERLSRPIEEDLEQTGYVLKGELELGALEPGFARLIEILTGITPSPSYLRIRRYEPDPEAGPAAPPGLRPNP